MKIAIWISENEVKQRVRMENLSSKYMKWNNFLRLNFFSLFQGYKFNEKVISSPPLKILKEVKAFYLPPVTKAQKSPGISSYHMVITNQSCLPQNQGLLHSQPSSLQGLGGKCQPFTLHLHSPASCASTAGPDDLKGLFQFLCFCDFQYYYNLKIRSFSSNTIQCVFCEATAYTSLPLKQEGRRVETPELCH